MTDSEAVVVVKTPVPISTFSRIGRTLSASWPDSVVRNGANGSFEIVLKGPYVGPLNGGEGT